MLLRGIHDRQLTAFQRVGLVGVDLVHHVDHRIAAGDQQPGLAVGRKVHVARRQRAAEGAADGLLAHMLHVERGLALPLRHQHARVEGAERHHVLQAFREFFVGQRPGPLANGLAVAVEHTDDRIGEIADFLRVDIHGRTRDRTRLGDGDLGEIRSSAGPDFRLGDMELENSIAFRHRSFLLKVWSTRRLSPPEQHGARDHWRRAPKHPAS